MLTAMRKRFGKVIVIGIIGLIVLVFLFFGVVSPDNQFGGVEAAGEVNGEPITYSEFARALDNRKAMFANLKIPAEQLKFLRIEASVFQELVQRKLVLQEAQKIGVSPSRVEIQGQILKIPAFQKDGAFSLDSYKAVLAANQWSPHRFEQMVSADLVANEWRSLFGRAVIVSDASIERAYREAQESRTVRYVLLARAKDQDVAKGEAELVKRADEVAARLGTAGEKSLSGIKKSEAMTRHQETLKDVGYVPELTRVLFEKPESLDPRSGGKARVFSVASGKLVAILDSKKEADMKGFTEQEKKKLRDSLQAERERALFSAWYRDRSKKAKITQNPKILAATE